jgi:aspartyl protease family protein
MMKRVIVALWLAAMGCAQAAQVQVMSIGPGQVQLLIDNATIRVLRPGARSPEGYRLVSVSGGKATIDVNGSVHRLGLGDRLEPTLVLTADSRGHFFTDIVINGRRARAVIDTGATGVAFNQTDAARLGVNYRNGRKGKAITASGEIDTYIIQLSQIQIGSLVARNVRANVNASPTLPPFVLVGMSALSQFRVITEGGSLHLIPK